MMKYLPVPSGRCLHLILALLMVCGSNFIASAQQTASQPHFSVALSGGYNKIHTGDNTPLFADANHGGFVKLSGILSLGKNWGCLVNLEHNFLSLDTHKATAYYLNADAKAKSVTITSGAFSMSNLGIGVYYDWAVAGSFFVRVSPSIGYSYLQTPKLDIAVITEPNTSYAYAKGESSALFYAVNVQPSLRISNRCALHLDLGYSYAAHNLSSSFDNNMTDNKVNYSKLNFGAGIQYAICK